LNGLNGGCLQPVELFSSPREWEFVVPFAFAGNDVALEIDQNEIVLSGFFKPDAGAFDLVLSRRFGQRRHMPINHIVVSLHRENAASQSKFFLCSHENPSRNCFFKTL
jgi:hypothetical protein